MDKRSPTGRFYDRIRPFYPMVDVFLRRQRRALVGEINRHSPGRLLEIGLGTGSHLPLYDPGLSVTGIDISGGMLRSAARHAGPGVKLVQMDGHNLEFPDGSFSCAVLSHVVAVAADPDRMLEEVHRVLQPGGTCFILNHFTARGRLGYIDRLFQPVGKLLHFRSNFSTADLSALRLFEITGEQPAGPFGYYKKIILRKK